MREVVLLSEGSDFSPTGTVAMKNRALGKKLAELFEPAGAPKPYYLPYDAIPGELANRRGIQCVDDLYGGVVRQPEHADKAILHTRVNNCEQAPVWYEASVARAVESAVLPGYTAFSVDEAIEGYQSLQNAGLCTRVKDPSERNARGQWTVGSKDELVKALANVPNLESTGVVLEANLRNYTTAAVGYVAIAGAQYSWYGQTWEATHEGEQKFGGNELTLVRGGFPELAKVLETPEQKMAVIQTSQTVNAYTFSGAVISRAMFDVMQGTASDGTFMSGVVDPSIRPSASSPAELHAVGVLKDQPEASVVTSRVTYDYGRQMTSHPTAELFAETPKTNIYVETVAAA